MAITISGENNNDRILAADGVIDQISGINFSGIITASHINVGSNIQLGNAGIITATTFIGNLTGNVNSTSNLLFQIGGSEKFRVGSSGQFGIAGANYGSSGQVFTSGGSGSAPSWVTPAVTGFTNGSNNRVVTATSGSGLNAETNLTYDGNTLFASGNITAASDGNRLTQGGCALVVRHSTNSAMRGNHFIQDDFPSGSATYYIQATESGVTNDRNLALQGYGGKVKIGSGGIEPVETLDVSGNVKATSINLANTIFHTGDTDTLIAFTTDTIKFETAGHERLRITSVGTVLKGLTTARQNYSNNTSGVEYGFQIEATSATKSSLSLIRSSNDANDGGIFIGKTRSTSVGGNTAVQAGDDLGTITFGGADGTSLLFGAEILAEVQSGVGNDDMPTDLIFKTNGGSTNTAERLRITSDGDVLIGTTTQAGKLTVDSGTANTCATFQSSDAGAVINLKDNTARSSIEQNGNDLKISADTDASDANSTIKLQVDGSTKVLVRDDGHVLFSGLTTKNDTRNAAGITIKSASGGGGISFQTYGGNGSKNWRIRPDDLTGWGTLEFSVSPTTNSATDWPDHADDVVMIMKPEKNVVIPNGTLGVGLNGTPSATFEVTDGGDYSHTKQGWARKRTFSVPIINNQQRWYKIVNYQAGNMLVGRLEIYTSRGGGFNQTKGYNEWRVSYGGHSNNIYGTSAENTSFQSGTGNSVDLVIGTDGGSTQNLYIKVPGSIYGGRVFFIFEGLYANWQWDESTYLTSAP